MLNNTYYNEFFEIGQQKINFSLYQGLKCLKSGISRHPLFNLYYVSCASFSLVNPDQILHH